MGPERSTRRRNSQRRRRALLGPRGDSCDPETHDYLVFGALRLDLLPQEGFEGPSSNGLVVDRPPRALGVVKDDRVGAAVLILGVLERLRILGDEPREALQDGFEVDLLEPEQQELSDEVPSHTV